MMFAISIQGISSKLDKKCKYIDDYKLAQLAAKGSSIAKMKLIMRILDKIRAIAYKMNNNNYDSEDMAQNACIEILNSLKTYSGIAPFEHWASSIATRVMWHDMKIKIKINKFYQTKDVSDFPSSISTEKKVSLKHAFSKVEKIIIEMDTKFGLALMLKIVLGYSIEEISSITSTPVNTVRERLRVGRKKLLSKIESDPFLKQWKCEDIYD